VTWTRHVYLCGSTSFHWRWLTRAHYKSQTFWSNMIKSANVNFEKYLPQQQAWQVEEVLVLLRLKGRARIEKTLYTTREIREVVSERRIFLLQRIWWKLYLKFLFTCPLPCNLGDCKCYFYILVLWCDRHDFFIFLCCLSNKFLHIRSWKLSSVSFKKSWRSAAGSFIYFVAVVSVRSTAALTAL